MNFGYTTAVELLKSRSLYSAVEIVEDGDELYSSTYDYLKNRNLQYDDHCVECQKNSTFKAYRISGGENRLSTIATWCNNPGMIINTMVCQRDLKHIYVYYLQKIGNQIVKVGQIPAIETIASSDIEKFKGVLDKSYFSELHRAGGLFSHGIGIGSFVYLRRVFEKLIWDHYEIVKATEGEIQNFAVLRMDEKINSLKAVLPPALVTHKSVYSILSKGIHELDEEACKKFYPPVRAAIIWMLEDHLQAKERERAAKELEATLQVITTSLQTPPHTK